MNNDNTKLIELLHIAASNADFLDKIISAAKFIIADTNDETKNEKYDVSEKDIGSLCHFTDYENDDHVYVGILTKIAPLDQPYKELAGDYWTHCKPYTDAIKLHFKPFMSTGTSVRPKDANEICAILWSDGDIIVYNNPPSSLFERNIEDDECDVWVIGYCPLSFVNPILDNK